MVAGTGFIPTRSTARYAVDARGGGVWLAGIAFILCLLAGCRASGGSGQIAAYQPLWVRDHGGLSQDGPSQHRLDTVIQRWHIERKIPIRCNVLNSDAVAAYAWPDGSVYLTRGLMSILTDEQLAAVLAHEAGHLLDHGYIASARSLQGHTDRVDREVRADRIGCQLLQSLGLSRGAMIDMLDTVDRYGELSVQERDMMAYRLAILRQSAGRSDRDARCVQ